MRALESSRFRFALLTFALVTILAGDIWRYSITWYGFGAIVLAVSVFSVLLLVRNRALWSIGGLPYPLLAFLLLITVSIAWSFYPGASAVGVVATWLTVLSAVAFAVSYSWAEILRALGIALRLLIAGSLLFELFVSVVLRRPLLPFWVSYDDLERPLAKSLYWSRDLLLDGGKIQGLPGNSALLGFLALLALIVFGVQLASASAHRVRTAVWFGLAALTLYLTRSATITLALVAVVVVLLAVWAIRRAGSPRVRVGLYAGFAALVAALVVGAVTLRDPILAALGKTPDLTGRSNIWGAVVELAQQRPVFGWGWVSYWAPWAPPFDRLAHEGGVRQLQAHNAWLDVWLQIGIVGLVVFGALVVSTLVRTWFLAVDRTIAAPGSLGTYSATSVVPLLVLTALLVQSIAESRLIIEYGMLLVVVAAVKTKTGDRAALS